MDKCIKKRGVRVCTYTHRHNGTLFSRKKEQNLAICDNLDGPRGYYAEGNMSYRERQML